MQENIVILGTGFIAGYLNRGLHYLFFRIKTTNGRKCVCHRKTSRKISFAY